MIFFFHHEVDNPVCILTQEMIEHFLLSKGEGDKYKVRLCVCLCISSSYNKYKLENCFARFL